MKGSICIDGISLTVAGLGADWFEVAIIPHTWRETTLSDLSPGDPVNLEVDVLAKYVERLMQHDAAPESKLTLEYLKEMGYQESVDED
jgi:riboflavin synthase